MKKLNKDLKVAGVIMALATGKTDQFIGAIVRFKSFDGRGTYHRDNIFEIVATQKAWGYNEKGEYTMIDAYRAFSVTCEDQIGTPCHLYELEIISMMN